MNNKVNEQGNTNKNYQRRNRNKKYGHYRKRPIRTQAKSNLPETKGTEDYKNMEKVVEGYKSMKKIVEALADQFIGTLNRMECTVSIVPDSILDSIPEYRETVGSVLGIGYALDSINEFFPLEGYISKDKAKLILSIIHDEDDCDIEEKCYDEIN